VSHFIAHMQHS